MNKIIKLKKLPNFYYNIEPWLDKLDWKTYKVSHTEKMIISIVYNHSIPISLEQIAQKGGISTHRINKIKLEEFKDNKYLDKEVSKINRSIGRLVKLEILDYTKDLCADGGCNYCLCHPVTNAYCGFVCLNPDFLIDFNIKPPKPFHQKTFEKYKDYLPSKIFKSKISPLSKTICAISLNQQSNLSFETLLSILELPPAEIYIQMIEKAIDEAVENKFLSVERHG